MSVAPEPDRMSLLRAIAKAPILFLILAAIAIPAARAQAVDDSELIDLAVKGSPEELSEALRGGADPNARDVLGESALMHAAEASRPLAIFSVLVGAGADVNSRDVEGRTALMLAAARCQDPEVIRFLLASGADAFARDREYETALSYALDFGRPKEIIDTLKEAIKTTSARSD